MKELAIGKNEAGMRLDRYLSKALPALPASLAQKYIRLKRIKVNGKRAERDTRLSLGDTVQCYINDEFFEVPQRRENPFLRDFAWELDILYEDDNLMLVNKAPGISVHPDDSGNQNTLLSHIQAYLYQKGEWDPSAQRSFAPALCNRLDRNTGGIVIAAKNAPALRVLNQKLRDREVDKRYLCLVAGCPNPEQGTLKGYVVKDERDNKVSVKSRETEEGKQAVTKYRTLASDGHLSLLECELVTGRTHQIRAMLARAGHPLIGDPKYGTPRINREYRLKYQALWSWSITFHFTTDAGPLAYLDGRTWQVPRVAFAERYFPGVAGQQ